MNIHEFQGKLLLKEYNVPVQEGIVIYKEGTPEKDKIKIFENLESVYAVKAQIHAGGRGKGKFLEKEDGEKGGVRITSNLQNALKEAKNMHGKKLVTKQTGKEGKEVNKV